MDYVIAFDFDGVLVDPVNEAVKAATFAHNKLNGTDFEEKFFHEHFRDTLHLIRTGLDVMPAIHFIAEGKPGVSREELNEYKRSLGKKGVLELEKIYYTKKKENRVNVEEWIPLIKPHEKAIEQFLKLREHFEVWIATTRAADSIKTFFSARGVELEKEKMIDINFSHDKIKQFKFISEKTGTPFNQIIFFEDTSFNSVAVKELGVNVFISTWGFSNEPQWIEAEKKGVKPIKQEEILSSVESVTGVKL